MVTVLGITNLGIVTFLEKATVLLIVTILLMVTIIRDGDRHMGW